MLQTNKILVGRYTCWADRTLLENFQHEPGFPAEGGQTYERSFAFLYQNVPPIVTRMNAAIVDDSAPDVFTATTGVEGEQNFVAVKVVQPDELSVDTTEAWSLSGLMEMLNPDSLHIWLETATVRENVLQIRADNVARNPRVALSLIRSMATSYEAVLDPIHGVVQSWTSFIGSRPSSKHTLCVRDFDTEFPSP